MAMVPVPPCPGKLVPVVTQAMVPPLGWVPVLVPCWAWHWGHWRHRGPALPCRTSCLAQCWCREWLQGSTSTAWDRGSRHTLQGSTSGLETTGWSDSGLRIVILILGLRGVVNVCRVFSACSSLLFSDQAPSVTIPWLGVEFVAGTRLKAWFGATMTEMGLGAGGMVVTGVGGDSPGARLGLL